MTSTSASASTFDHSNKISPAFAARLAKLNPGQEIRAIVLPVIPPANASDRTMARSARRQATQDAIEEVTKAAFVEVDRQMADTGGKRLTQSPNRLGFVHIEAPAQSIHALADQEWVKTIIEDQSIRQL